MILYVGAAGEASEHQENCIQNSVWAFRISRSSFWTDQCPCHFHVLDAQRLCDFLDRFVIIFIDDILIHRKSLKEHAEHLRQVFTRLREHCLFVKHSKERRIPLGFGPAKAFDSIKCELTSYPTLVLPNPSHPDVIWTDASQVATGAILCQDQGHGLQPIAFESRKLKPAKCNYSTHDREVLAIVHAIKKWRCYVHMQPVTVLTDHCTLQYLKTQPHLTPR
ncbi:hypothetical protein CLOP_g6284 [Closterium sp. NIES-67]|nr:hypothetical protein CLOP_g6284 [Closterium sp. NIES-67]